MGSLSEKVELFYKCVVREFVFHYSFVLNYPRCSSVVQGLPSFFPPNTAALRLPEHSVTAAVPRTMTKETNCTLYMPAYPLHANSHGRYENYKPKQNI